MRTAVCLSETILYPSPSPFVPYRGLHTKIPGILCSLPSPPPVIMAQLEVICEVLINWRRLSNLCEVNVKKIHCKNYLPCTAYSRTSDFQNVKEYVNSVTTSVRVNRCKIIKIFEFNFFLLLSTHHRKKKSSRGPHFKNRCFIPKLWICLYAEIQRHETALNLRCTEIWFVRKL